MPRPPRQDFAGAWHHVMNRGADHRDIFQHDADRSAFLDSLAIAAERSALEVHAYCLMSNHFHLLVRSQEGRLAGGMQHLSGRFTRLVNVRVGRDGPLFRGRYASVGIDDDGHLTQAVRYIHRNPIEAGLVSVAEAWPWSSAAVYVGAVGSPTWLRTDFVLDLFGPRDPLASYSDFMRTDSDPATSDFYAKLGW
jgi:REP element-mobilizing transposase RayT